MNLFPKSIKLVVTDMDGTLLDNEQCISEYTQSVLQDAQAKGIGIVLASGRNLESLVKYGRQIKLNEYQNNGFITLNGLETYNNLGKVIEKHQRLSNVDLYEIDKIASSNNITLLIFYEINIYMIRHGKVLTKEEYLDTTQFIECPISHIETLNEECILKAVLIAEEGLINETLNHLSSRIINQYEISRVEKQWVEINPKGITKGLGLLNYLKKYNISSDEIVVFGNGENDLSMFKITNNSVATYNALDFVKEQVSYICDSHNNDGVAKFIEKYIL